MCSGETSFGQRDLKNQKHIGRETTGTINISRNLSAKTTAPPPPRSLSFSASTIAEHLFSATRGNLQCSPLANQRSCFTGCKHKWH